mmetsp:Transcript_2852/g.6638  ORF Transcript_2852/g.6638 Transcript_2852/m.6638 type:complete len:253 (-) Transcript_2852:253-1011(-)
MPRHTPGHSRVASPGWHAPLCGHLRRRCRSGVGRAYSSRDRCRPLRTRQHCPLLPMLRVPQTPFRRDALAREGQTSRPGMAPSLRPGSRRCSPSPPLQTSSCPRPSRWPYPSRATMGFLRWALWRSGPRSRRRPQGPSAHGFRGGRCSSRCEHLDSWERAQGGALGRMRCAGGGEPIPLPLHVVGLLWRRRFGGSGRHGLAHPSACAGLWRASANRVTAGPRVPILRGKRAVGRQHIPDGLIGGPSRAPPQA